MAVMPTDPFHLSLFVILPGLGCAVVLIGRAFNDDRRPDWRHILLSCVCGITAGAGAILGIVFLVPLMQMIWSGLIGEMRPWPTFTYLRPLFLGLGWLAGIFGASAMMMWPTGVGVSKE
jgi:uncharacterized oligopeptide transporter (OPT) family protein